MLHVRVVCPAERTDAVLALLRDRPGATHVVLGRGAALAPAGDLVEADVAREAADGLLAGLCELGIDRDGGITVQPVDTTLSDAGDRAQEQAPGDGADAVVWEELISRSGEESRLNATFLAFLVIACLLAAVGAVTDSPVTVVGAMVVGPEFGPLAALAVGLVRRRRDLMRRAVLALAVGFPLAMLITAGATALGELGGLFDRTALDTLRQVDFIYEVGPFSLIVAMLAGAAGMLSLTSTKSAALVGVFISVTTVPAAGFAALAAVLGQWERALGSSVQLVINLIGIVLSASLVLWLRHRPVRGSGRPLSAA
ncbi:MAG TPA: DUF389 domain-containing protein [Pseudonocardiaceae bacterium]